MLIPDGYAQANLRFSGTALPTGAEVVLGLNVEVGPSTPLEVAEEVALAWAAGMNTLQTNQVTLSSVLVKFGPTSTGPSAEFGCNIPGTVSNPTAPPNVTFLVKKLTPNGGRQGQGRMYVPGVGEGFINQDGLIDATQLTTWRTQVDGFLGDLTAGGLVPALLHAEGSPISAPYLVTSFFLDNKVATQRRRLRR